MATTSPGLTPAAVQASRHGLNRLAVLGIAQAASVRGVHECGLIAVASAGIQHQVVQKTALGSAYSSVRAFGKNCIGKIARAPENIYPPSHADC